MPKGFFSPILNQAVHTPRVSYCGECGLSGGCRSPKMPWTGEGRKGILVVAEAPGEMEDRENTQLVGKAGQRLRRTLRKLGVDLDRDCWKTNAVICCPEKRPTERQVVCCRPNLLKTIDLLKPDVILLLGTASVKSLIGHVWKEDVGAIGRWVGWRIPCQRSNAWLCPTWHSSYLLRQSDPVLDLWFENHLEAALELEGKPWPDGTPNYAAQVERIYEPSRAAGVLRKMVERGGTVAFDYETDRLKPDHPDASIVSCAVCWEGKKTIAYPWHGEAIKATGELLRSGLGKIGALLKFEQRWTNRVFGHGVRNWQWDTVATAHVLDSRSAITSVKFQSFVRLGMGPYDEEVGPYFRADSSNEPNRIREIPLDRLLLYNSLDALLEFKIAELQRKEMNNERC